MGAGHTRRSRIRRSLIPLSLQWSLVFTGLFLWDKRLRTFFILTLLFIPGCSRYASPVCLSGAFLDADRYCSPSKAPVHHIPFRHGFSTTVTQGFHGLYSHKGDEAYAIDFSCDSGDPIAASRSGKVLTVKEDSDEGCSDSSCTDLANYITIDHGDGTFSEYGHLQHLGALVEEGDNVCAGDLIGLCGTTGYSISPHLHFSLLDQSRRTLPVQFAEPRVNRGFGFAVPDTKYESQNGHRASCKKVNYSPLSRNAFAHQGIVLSEDIEIEFDTEARVLEGEYFGDYPYVAIHKKAVDESDWKVACYPVKEGRFKALIDWELEDKKGSYFLMLVGADERCSSPVSGWSWAYLIRYLR